MLPVTQAHRDRVAELDVLRGIAALLMVLNHAGYALLSPAASATGWSAGLVFVGSFAPVLFFFITGVGAGLTAGKSASPLETMWPTLDKVLLLFLADLLLTWRGDGLAPRLDFFGFIGVSMAALWLVQRFKDPVRAALLGCVGLLLARYGLGALKPDWLPDAAVLQWLIGTPAQSRISYPLSPWLVYPLLGFALARQWQPAQVWLRRPDMWRWAAAIGLFALAAAIVQAMRGASFHRWGTMAAGYFMLSLVVLVATAAAAAVLQRWRPHWASGLALNGIAAFAVVPLHYLLVGAMSIGDAYLSSGGFVPAYVLMASLTLVAARAFGQAVERHGRRPGTKIAIVAALAVAGLSVAGLIVLHLAGDHSQIILSGVGQLAVAALFGWRFSASRCVGATHSARLGSSS
jgi:uncharacterized membrane protein